MKHCGTQRLETDRLVLRRFERADADAMYRNWASDPEVTKYLTWPAHENIGVTQEVLDRWVKQYDGEKFYQWAITLKENGNEPIGSISVVKVDELICMVQVGYALGRAWWRQGIMTESMKTVMNFLFDTVEVERIESRHDPRNPNSGGVMRKSGMFYEGMLHHVDHNSQGICDACCYALLRSER